MTTKTMNLPICELPSSEFEMGGEIDRMAREAGYASGHSFVSDHRLWSATVGEVVEILKAQGASISHVGHE